MQYRSLGRTGLKVSAISLGSMSYGDQVTEADAIAIIRRAMAGGVNFFDTADGCVGGRAEEIVGKALGRDRNSVVLATKVGSIVGPGTNDRGLSRKHIIEGVESSLRRLGTDHIDVYYVHYADYSVPLLETLGAMDTLVRQGNIRYAGCSNFRAWLLCKSLWASDVHSFARFDCVQPPYNLLARDSENELLPLCASESVGVCVYNPLAGGLLTGKYNPDAPPPRGTRFTHERWGASYTQRYWTAANFAAVEALAKVARDHGRTMPQFALAWVLRRPEVASAICGATSTQQLDENLGAADVTLTEEELAACDEVWRRFRPPRFFYGDYLQV